MNEWPAGADLISEKHYLEFVFPYTQRAMRAMKEQGLEVSAAYVSSVLHAARKKKPRKRAAAEAPVAQPALPADAVSISALQKAKKLAEEMGGIEPARAALQAFARLWGG